MSYKVKDLKAFSNAELVEECNKVAAKVDELRKYNQFGKYMRAGLGRSLTVLMNERVRRASNHEQN